MFPSLAFRSDASILPAFRNSETRKLSAGQPSLRILRAYRKRGTVCVLRSLCIVAVRTCLSSHRELSAEVRVSCNETHKLLSSCAEWPS
jgi:hypothetical protein